MALVALDAALVTTKKIFHPGYLGNVGAVLFYRLDQSQDLAVLELGQNEGVSIPKRHASDLLYEV
jgi:hypothetical protein